MQGRPGVLIDAPRRYLWERTPPSVGHSLARVAPIEGGGWTLDAAEVLRDDGTECSCTFTVVVDAAWGTRSVRVRSVAHQIRELTVSVAEGRWSVDGAERPDLTGCVDVDVAATPLTNTIPIRRLADLPVGRSVTTPVAWVDVPALDVRRVDQTYTRLGPSAWEYADPMHGAFRLTVDDDGVVVDYEGFATRV